MNLLSHSCVLQYFKHNTSLEPPSSIAGRDRYMRPLSFYYASFRSLLLGAPSQYVFSISVALSLLLTYAPSSLFGGNWGSIISGLATFPIQTLWIVIVLWWIGHDCNMLRKGIIICWLFKRVRGEGAVELQREVFLFLLPYNKCSHHTLRNHF